MARRRETRAIRDPLPTVIGAGLTEKWYFRHLKDLCGYKLELKPKYFGSDTAHDMQKIVENVLAIGGKAICIFDMDTTQWDASERKRKEQFIARYKDNPDVILCDSACRVSNTGFCCILSERIAILALLTMLKKL